MKWRNVYSPLATIAFVLAFAASAQAHSSQILIQSSTLIYEEIPGIAFNPNNNATIALKSDSTGSYYEIRDLGSTGMFFPSQCTPLDPSQEDIRCPAAGIRALYVRLGTGYYSDTSTDTITITAPTPATVSGGSVTNAGGPRTSNITVGPVGGNVIYGNPGSGTVNSLNGFADTIHACPGNVVKADPTDTVIWDCAPPPDPPGTLPKPPPSPPPSSQSPALSPTIKLTYKQPQAIMRRRLIELHVSASTPVTLHARGAILLPGRGRRALLGKSVSIQAVGVSVRVRLRVPRRLLEPLLRAFARHRRLYAEVHIDASDPANGASYTLVRRIALVR